jgi:hypothetical protein
MHLCAGRSGPLRCDLLLTLAAPERARPRPGGGGPPIVEYGTPSLHVVDLRALAAIPPPAG